MTKIKKVFNLLVALIFLYQNAAFGVSDKNLTLRPPLLTTESTERAEETMRRLVGENVDSMDIERRREYSKFWAAIVQEGLDGLNKKVRFAKNRKSREDSHGISLVNYVSPESKLAGNIRNFQSELQSKFGEFCSINSHLHLTVAGININKKDSEISEQEFNDIESQIQNILNGVPSNSNFKIYFANDIGISKSGNITLQGYVIYTQDQNLMSLRSNLEKGLKTEEPLVMKGIHITLGTVNVKEFDEKTYERFIDFIVSYRKTNEEFGWLDVEEVVLVRHGDDYLMDVSKIARFSL